MLGTPLPHVDIKKALHWEGPYLGVARPLKGPSSAPKSKVSREGRQKGALQGTLG
jgi:hypothetical protein